MSSSVLSDYGELYALVVARFAAMWRRKEPRLRPEVEDVITKACHRIDEQDAKLKLQNVQLRLRDVEIELLKSELEWATAVLCKSNVVLGTYDYIRLQQLNIKVRAMRSRC